jgi:hypothetical protein
MAQDERIRISVTRTAIPFSDELASVFRGAPRKKKDLAEYIRASDVRSLLLRQSEQFLEQFGGGRQISEAESKNHVYALKSNEGGVLAVPAKLGDMAIIPDGRYLIEIRNLNLEDIADIEGYELSVARRVTVRIDNVLNKKSRPVVVNVSHAEAGSIIMNVTCFIGAAVNVIAIYEKLRSGAILAAKDTREICSAIKKAVRKAIDEFKKR